MVIELRVVQFWSEIILAISNRTRAARSFDFEITHMISDQIALHSVQLPLLIPLCHRSSWPASIHLLRMHQAHAWSCDSIQDFCRSNIKQIRFIFTGPVKTYRFTDYSQFVSLKVRTPWKFRILVKEIFLIR